MGTRLIALIIVLFEVDLNNCVNLLADMGEDALAVPMPDRPSSRRMLNKCRGKTLLTNEQEKNNNAHMLGLKSDSSLPMYLQACSQAGMYRQMLNYVKCNFCKLLWFYCYY